MKKLRIVIPTKNEEMYLPRLLFSIKKQTYKDYEIVVADANSEDKTKEIAKKNGCRVVEGGYLDIGRNNGAKNCKTKLIIFIDADVILPNENFLKLALEEFEEKKFDLATFLQKPVQSKSILKRIVYFFIHEFVNINFLIFQKTKFPLMQSCILMKTNVHKKLGGFPPLEFGEDSALAKIAVKKGYRFGVLRKAGKIILSTRRYEEKGIIRMLIKYIYFNITRLFGKEHYRGKTKIKYW